MRRNEKHLLLLWTILPPASLPLPLHLVHLIRCEPPTHIANADASSRFSPQPSFTCSGNGCNLIVRFLPPLPAHNGRFPRFPHASTPHQDKHDDEGQHLAFRDVFLSHGLYHDGILQRSQQPIPGYVEGRWNVGGVGVKPKGGEGLQCTIQQTLSCLFAFDLHAES